MMNANNLLKHKVPVVVTAIGLLTAFGLGVAPAMKSDPPKPDQVTAEVVAQGAENSTQLLELSQRLDQMQANTSARLGNIENQIAILNKAVSRTSQRMKSLKDTLPEGLAARLSSNETQLGTVNKAMARTFKRVKGISIETDALVTTVSDMRPHDIQIQTLNKAVKQLNIKLSELENAVAAAAK